MIPLDRIKACSNPTCRLVLPADPNDEPNAGFWVAKREGGAGTRVVRFASWCKDCTRTRSREMAGIRRRGRPYEVRVPQDKEARARYLVERLEILQERHREGLSNPKYVAQYRAKQRERARRARRRVGIYPRNPTDSRERLPVAPLRAFFDATGLSHAEIARRIGVVEDRIGQLRRGYCYHRTKKYGSRRYEIRAVSFGFGLRVAQALSVDIEKIWPDVFGVS